MALMLPGLTYIKAVRLRRERILTARILRRRHEQIAGICWIDIRLISVPRARSARGISSLDAHGTCALGAALCMYSCSRAHCSICPVTDIVTGMRIAAIALKLPLRRLLGCSPEACARENRRRITSCGVVIWLWVSLSERIADRALWILAASVLAQGWPSRLLLNS